MYFIHEGIGCSEEHAIELARVRYEEKLDEHRSRAGRTVQSPIMLSDEGDEDEDDTSRLSELITERAHRSSRGGLAGEGG